MEKHMWKKVKDICFVLFIAVMAMASVVIVVSSVFSGSFFREEEPLSPRTDAVEVRTETRVVEKEVEKKITAEIIEEGLKDMGVLVTQEYDFTITETQTRTKKIFLGLNSTSGFIFSYDGNVTAGIDFGKVEVAKDEERKQLRISVPKAEIRTVTVDPETFVLYSEKEGFANPLSMEDYNVALTDLYQQAEERAVERGIPEKADAQAERTIAGFVHSLIPEGEYELVIEHREPEISPEEESASETETKTAEAMG